MGRRTETVVVVGLCVLAVASVLAGLGLTWVSNCCTSREPADPRPLLAGLLIGGCLATAAAGIRATWPPWGVLGPAAALPLGCLLAAPHSSDLALVAMLAVPAWCLLAWLMLRR